MFKAGKAGIYVSCRGRIPAFEIVVRDPVPLTMNVRLQFDGHQSRRSLSFVGDDGAIKNYTFSRGRAATVAMANVQDSREIVRELFRGHERLAYRVDTVDGFDSLEVSAIDFATAWKSVGCADDSRAQSSRR